MTRERVTVTVPVAIGRALVTLAETMPGAGDWCVVGTELRAEGGHTLSADVLRNFPWSSVLESARREVAGGTRPHMVAFGRVSDPPAAFRVSRRGKAARTDSEYAQLAASYIAFPAERRHKAAAQWALRFPALSDQRWRMHLKRAREYIETCETGSFDDAGEPLTDLCLTEEGMRLVHGEDIFDRLDREHEVDSAEERLGLLSGGGLGTAKRADLDFRIARYARQRGIEPEEVRDALRNREETHLRDFYSDGLDDAKAPG